MRNAAVIVTYNRLSLLKECVDAVRAQTMPFEKVFIIDNCSTDGTGEYLDGLDSGFFSILHETDNRGGAGGFSDGLALAGKGGYDWILLIDDDAIIDADYMRILTTYGETNPHAPAVAGSVWVDGKIDITHRRCVTSRLLYIEKCVPEEEYAGNGFYCDAATFCGLCVRGDAVAEIGLPRDDYFIWYDDSEYCLRLNTIEGSRGIAVIPAAKLNHKTKLPPEGAGLLMRTSWRHYYGYRNRYDTARRHFGRSSAFFVRMEYDLLWLSSAAMMLSRDADKRKKSRFNMAMISRAADDAARGRFGMRSEYLPPQPEPVQQEETKCVISPAPKRSVTAVVVTYNRREMLERCIYHLQKTHLSKSLRNRTDFQILIVDNHSTDSTGDWLAKRFLPENMADDRYPMRCITTEENVGGAGGFYRGMKEAMKDTPDLTHFWLMDDDTMVYTDTLDALLHAEHSAAGCGFLASDVRWMDGKPCLMNLAAPSRKESDLPGMKAVASATFVSVLVPVRSALRFGLPKPEYFIWGDDKEYTLRISDHSPCYQVTTSRVTHEMSANTGSSIAKDQPDRIDRYFYAYRNDYATARERGAGATMLFFLGAALNTLRILFSSHEYRTRRLSIMHKGIAAGAGFMPPIRFPDGHTVKKLLIGHKDLQ